MKIEDINEKFDHLYRVIASDAFLRMEALGGEIPFFIATYNPAQQTEVEPAIRSLKNKLETQGVPVLDIDLYEVCLQVLEQELGLQEVFQLERDMDPNEFKNALQSVLDIHQVLMPAVRARVEQATAKVYFLTGIGLVYPYIRSHNILNNLQSVATSAPTVLFFPGRYTGQSLELFGILKDDNYYRAFNIDQYKL